MRICRLPVAAAGGAALVLALTPGATAAPPGAVRFADVRFADVRFVDAAQWHAVAAGYGTWTSGEVRPGRRAPEFYCVNEPMPVDRTTYRSSDGERAGGYQHVTLQPSERSAKRLVARWVRNMKACLTEEWVGKGKVGFKVLGEYPKVADGLLVIAAKHRYAKDHWFFPNRAGVDLFGVGRDGRLVTTLELDLPVTLERAPVRQFAALSKTALKQLRP